MSATIRTKSDYAAYVNRVKAFYDHYGIDHLGQVINPETEESEQPYFSWLSCPCCKSHLGGMRYRCCAFSLVENEVIDDFDICPDCLYYSAYGRLDDQTMIALEKSAE